MDPRHVGSLVVRMRARTLPLVALLVATALAGCFASDGPADTSGDGGMDDGAHAGNETAADAEIYVVGTDRSLYPESLYTIRPETAEVRAGDVVNLTFKNALGNSESHSLVLEGYDVKIGPIEESVAESVTFTADQTGTFAYYCDIGNHRELGMEGQLTVS